MKEPRISKVTMNIGVGEPGERMQKAELLLNRMTGSKVVRTKARVTEPAFGIKKNQEIGVKVTVRGKKAEELLKNALAAAGNTIKESSFDNKGNFSFGVKESIDMPSLKYDPEIGIFGFDVCVALERKGYRVARRKRARSKIGRAHLLSKTDAMEFAKKLGVNIIGET